MGKKRRRHSSEFKAKVALEALKGLKTRSELASQFDVHPVLISTWKKELVQNLPSVFGNGQLKLEREHEDEKAQLFEKIGRLEVENDWLKKKLENLP